MTFLDHRPKSEPLTLAKDISTAAGNPSPPKRASVSADVLDEMIEINGGQLHLRADDSYWLTVAETHNAAAGIPIRFITIQPVGYLTFTDRLVVAVVGVCSRCGCLLHLDAASDSLRCPASGARFRPNGQVLNPAGHYRPPPLTRLHAQLTGGQLQALVPGPSS